jgi:hypothetical protein
MFEEHFSDEQPFGGGGRVRLALTSDRVPIGGSIAGQVVLSGGASPRRIDRVRIVGITDETEPQHTKVDVLRGWTLPAGGTHHEHFDLRVPGRGLLGARLELRVLLEAPPDWVLWFGAARSVCSLPVYFAPPLVLVEIAEVLSQVSGIPLCRWAQPLRRADFTAYFAHQHAVMPRSMDLHLYPRGDRVGVRLSLNAPPSVKSVRWKEFRMSLPPGDHAAARAAFERALQEFRRAFGPTGGLPIPVSPPDAPLPIAAAAPALPISSRPIPSAGAEEHTPRP